MSSQTSQESINKLKIDDITMLDEYMDLGGFSEESRTVFRSENIGFRPMEFDVFSHMGVVYEMDFDMRSYHRRVYTILDWLSDVGGLSGALFAAFGAICRILTFNGLHCFLIESLYKRKQLEHKNTNETNSSSDNDNS